MMTDSDGPPDQTKLTERRSTYQDPSPRYPEVHPDVPSEGRLRGIIAVLIGRLGGRVMIEGHELRAGCLSPALIVPQTDGSLIIGGQS